MIYSSLTISHVHFLHKSHTLGIYCLKKNVLVHLHFASLYPHAVGSLLRVLVAEGVKLV